MLVLATSACTKQRPTQWPDGEEEGIFEKSFIQGQDVTLRLSDLSVAAVGKENDLRSVTEMPKKPVLEALGPERLKPIFKDLKVEIKGVDELHVRFKIDRKFITAYKVIPELLVDELGIVERQLALVEKNKDKENEFWVPLFQYEIQSQGLVERVKNDLGEDTNILRIKETEPERATHVKFSTLATSRVMVSVPATAEESGEKIFLRSTLDGRLLNKKELDEKLAISVSLEARYVTRMKGEKLSLFEVTKLTLLNTDMQEIIRGQDRGNLLRGDVARCPADVLEQLESADRGDCVVVLRYEIPAKTVVAKRRKFDVEGTLSPEINFENSIPVTQGESLIRIIERAEPVEINTGEQVAKLNPTRTLVVGELKGQDFLFRRTLQDSPNAFQYTFAGASGRLEIVRFLFEKERVRIVRADPLLNGGGTTDVDSETLMSLPANYVRLVSVDAQGNRLETPRIVAALPDEPGALAYVDWTKNSIPTVASPLEYYGVEQCFNGALEREVAGVDQRLGPEGVLNFSLVSTYAASLAVDCAGIMGEDYFDNVQKTFTFKERISFKKHVVAAGDKEEPLLNLPYEAQKRLGFGLFTYTKKVPDASGRVGIDGTEIPLPAVFDLRDGKKIVYHLAGLPQGSDEKSTRVREAIIKATQRVIRDLNAGFRQALVATPLQRNDDVIELVVDDSKKGQLGDLDRNHIFYVEKTTESGVIGLGGAHHNPRSGRVEAASVYLYGGNMMSMIADLRKISKARKEYQAIMAGQPVEGQGTSPAVLAGSSGRGSSQARALRRSGDLQSLSPASLRSLMEMSQNFGGKKSFQKELRQTARKVQHFAVPAGVSRDDIASTRVALSKQTLDFKAAFDAAVSQHALGNVAKMTKLFAGAKGRQLPGVIERMRDSKLCIFQVNGSDLLEAAGSPMLDKADDVEVLAEVWASTLAHEVGHNLGLRHNFEGSYDLANWRFNAGDESTRNYSSVMDYISDEIINYDGLGPQDIAALRAAYAGVVDTVEGKSVSIAKIPALIGASSWLEVDESRLSPLNLKKYRFCSDEDAGLSPTCNRFDAGTNPSEVVENVIRSHRELYAIRNFPGDKLHFDVRDQGEYVGRLFARLIPVRQFLEETFYQLIQGADEKTINEHVEGLFKGLVFLHEIVRTPDFSNLGEGNERFTQEEFEVPGADPNKPEKRVLTVESKTLRDLRQDMRSDRLKVRGTELDKAVATILLTERNMGFPRYEDISLRIAYPDFERMVFQVDSPLQLPTVGLLNEVLSERVQPMLASPQYGLLPLPMTYKAESTELTRFLSLSGAILSLDVDGLEAGDNNSTLFRVMSGFNVEKGQKFIQQPGANARDLKYWAIDDSVVGASLVDGGSTLAEIRRLVRPELSAQIQQWFAGQLEGKATPEQAALTKELNEALAALPESGGPRTIEELEPYMNFVYQNAAGLQPFVGDPRVDPRLVSIEVEKVTTMAETLAKALPNAGVAMAALDGASLGVALVDSIKPARTLGTQEGLLFRNVQTLSSFFFMAHPEYNR